MSSGEALVALGTAPRVCRMKMLRRGSASMDRTALLNPRRTLLQQFAAQFKESLVVLLLISAGVSAAVGEVEDALVIAVIVVLNAVIGVAQNAGPRMPWTP